MYRVIIYTFKRTLKTLNKFVNDKCTAHGDGHSTKRHIDRQKKYSLIENGPTEQGKELLNGMKWKNRRMRISIDLNAFSFPGSVRLCAMKRTNGVRPFFFIVLLLNAIFISYLFFPLLDR